MSPSRGLGSKTRIAASSSERPLPRMTSRTKAMSMSARGRRPLGNPTSRKCRNGCGWVLRHSGFCAAYQAWSNSAEGDGPSASSAREIKPQKAARLWRRARRSCERSSDRRSRSGGSPAARRSARSAAGRGMGALGPEPPQRVGAAPERPSRQRRRMRRQARARVRPKPRRRAASRTSAVGPNVLSKEARSALSTSAKVALRPRSARLVTP